MSFDGRWGPSAIIGIFVAAGTLANLYFNNNSDIRERLVRLETQMVFVSSAVADIRKSVK